MYLLGDWEIIHICILRPVSLLCKTVDNSFIFMAFWWILTVFFINPTCIGLAKKKGDLGIKPLLRLHSCSCFWARHFLPLPVPLRGLSLQLVYCKLLQMKALAKWQVFRSDQAKTVTQPSPPTFFEKHLQQYNTNLWFS